MTRHTRRSAPRALTAAALVVAAASLLPAVYLLAREGFSLGLLGEQLSAPSTGPLIWNTIQLLILVGISCVVLGVGLAVLVARTDIPWRRVWIVGFTLPLGVPSFVGSYTWVATSYRVAPSSTFIYGLRGAWIVLTLALFPYVFLPTLVALRGLDPAQEETARSLGDSAWRAFTKVTLPRLRIAIAGGLLIISLHLLAEFGALQMLRYETLTTAVVNRATVLGSPEAARALAVVLAVGAIGILVLDRLIRGSGRDDKVGEAPARTTSPWRLSRMRWPSVGLAGVVVMASLGVPLYATAAGIVPYFTRSTSAVVDWDLLAQSGFNTAKYALAAALGATVVAFPVSLISVRFPGPVSVFAERSVWVAHALPGVIVALSLVYLSVRFAYPLYQTSTLLVIAYVVMFLPLAVAAQQVGVAQASGQLEEVSRSLGDGPWRTFKRVTLPLVAPAAATGAMFVALDAGKELTTTLLLHPTGENTLATALWGTTKGEVLDFTAAAPYGVLLLIIGAVPAVLLARRTLRG